jgi:thymidylate synthase
MNNIDKQYQDLLQDILDNGINKTDRTGTGTISVFGRQIRHKMSDGFPLLTTKKLHFKSIVVELLWFLRGDTNIKYLVDNGCHIWDGDAYKNYEKGRQKWEVGRVGEIPNLSKEEFINKIKTDNEFAKKWGDLGPVYGKQWRQWGDGGYSTWTDENDKVMHRHRTDYPQVDQIANLINDLKTNPDSRRLMVNAWNVGELDQMVLPPCHYGFQVYTRELSREERIDLYAKEYTPGIRNTYEKPFDNFIDAKLTTRNIPTRAISLMWNQRSVDTFLGLPFNIASYGLLLEIIAKEVNMVPDELIGNLGDVHLYSNHVEQAKEQIGRDYTLEERLNMVSEEIQNEFSSGIVNLPNFPNTPVWSDDGKMSCLDDFGVPRRTREPYKLPTLRHLKTNEFYKSLGDDLSLITHLDNTDFVIENYQSHPSIKAPLSS